MGACLTLDQEEKKARARSFAIDKQLEHLARQETNVIKLLLLGKFVPLGGVMVCCYYHSCFKPSNL